MDIRILAPYLGNYKTNVDEKLNSQSKALSLNIMLMVLIPVRTTFPLAHHIFYLNIHFFQSLITKTASVHTFFYKKVVGKKVVLDLPELKKVLVLA